MRITVFGAAGGVGRRILAEALSRGHHVTAAVRTPSRFADLPAAAAHRTGDAADLADVIALSTGQDAVISATRPAPGRERDLVTTATTLLTGTARTGARLLLVGGAATLTLPGTDTTLLASPRTASYRPIAQACADQLAACRAHTTADWTYLSPPEYLRPGKRTGRYRLGTDELLTTPSGHSHISIEDLAVALLDETENPKHPRTRFTAAY